MTRLESLPETDSGHIVKRQAVQWLEEIDEATEDDLKETVISKPKGFTGSKYSTEVSTIRITGAPEFVEAAGSLFKPLLDFENEETRLEVNLQRTENRNTEELTDNYALYLSVAERG